MCFMYMYVIIQFSDYGFDDEKKEDHKKAQDKCDKDKKRLVIVDSAAKRNCFPRLLFIY